jgi:hypothetical protein
MPGTKTKHRLSHVELAILKLHYPNYAHVLRDGPRRDIQNRLVNLGYLFRVGTGCLGIMDTGIEALTDAGML